MAIPGALGITTTRGRTMRAIDFLKHAAWMSVGRTQPWPDEAAPPPETPETLRLDTVLGYVRAQEVAIVIPSATGTVEFLQRTYAKLSPKQALKEGARQVYLRFQFGDELGVGGKYRQVGVQQDLLAAPGLAEHDVLLPPQVVLP